MKRSRLGWIVFWFSVSILTLQWIRFLPPFAGHMDPSGTIPFYHIFFCVFAVCCTIMFISRSRFYFYISWTVFALFVLLFNFYFASLGLVSFTLGLLAIIHISLYERFPANLVFACVFSVISALSLGLDPTTRTGSGASGILFGDLDYFSYCIAMSGVSSLMIHYREKLVSARKELTTLNNAIYELTRANLKYQDYAQDVRERSMEQERQRITRDIHDIAGYALTNAMMMAQSGKIMLRHDPEKLPAHLDGIREAMSRCMDEIRMSLRNLRSIPVTEPAGFTSISRMAHIFGMATKIHVRVEYTNVTWHFNEAESEVIYHFIQEALINSFRHGKPTAIRILFQEDEDLTKINVLDNGKGTTGIREGIGIAGMRERVESIGGRIDIASAVDGFSITIYIPRKAGREHA